jgi:hypothetical protein
MFIVRFLMSYCLFLCCFGCNSAHVRCAEVPPILEAPFRTAVGEIASLGATQNHPTPTHRIE